MLPDSRDKEWLLTTYQQLSFLPSLPPIKANRRITRLSNCLALLLLFSRPEQEGRKYQEDVNEKDISDHSNTVAVGGMGRGANLAQHAAVDNTGHKLATAHNSINLTQPATGDSRYQLDHDADHDHSDHSDLKQQQHFD